MTAIRFHAEFEDDLEVAWLWIARDDPAAADRFVEAAEHTCAQIARQPQIGWERPWKRRKLTGLRSWRVEAFPNYLVFYRIEAEAVAMVALMHGARSFERILVKRLIG